MATQHPEPLYLLVHLVVAPGEEKTFRTYERRAIDILRRHGGELLYALRPETEPDRMHEIHLIRLPSHDALDAYRQDPALLAMREMRATAITSTSITLAGEITSLYAPPTLTIRDAVVADASAIAHVHVASWQTTYRGVVPDEYLDSLNAEDRIPARERELAEPKEDAVRLVAEIEGEGIVGFSFGGRDRDEERGVAEIYAIYLRKEWEGRGIGGELVRESVRRFIASGMERMVIWVLKENRARGFYERLGGVARREKELRIAGAMLQVIGYEWDDIRVMLE